MQRRTVIKGMAAAGAAMAVGETSTVARPTPALPGVSQLEKPVAIAMWDFSWLHRHHPAGSFHDWDRVLDGLVERGYNAVRMDCFPPLVAAQPDGKVQESFYLPKNDWKPAMWGNQYSVDVRPREGLLEFLPKCRDRGVHVGLSTWFFGPGVGKVEGLDGFVRVWTETLAFLEEHGLLDNVLYVDLLNEYPMFHGFEWFKKHLDSLGEVEPDPAAADRLPFEWVPGKSTYNPAQTRFYRDFGAEAIKRLRARWPQFDYMICQTYSGVPWQNMDFSEYNVLDVHTWFIMNGLLPTDTGYWENIHSLAENDRAFADVSKKIHANWYTHKDTLAAWMDELVGQIGAKARELGVPCGNTEGWGPINWLDHPYLDWDMLKEAGELGAKLGAKHGYMFNCTSNFTHPHFARLWDDIDWHRKVTDIIRNGA